jgi:hypothetical protein
VANFQWGLQGRSFTYIGCGSLQDIRIHQVFMRLLSATSIIEGCHVILTETNGAKSMEIITKSNFNDHARDLDLNHHNNALKRRKLN